MKKYPLRGRVCKMSYWRWMGFLPRKTMSRCVNYQVFEDIFLEIWNKRKKRCVGVEKKNLKRKIERSRNWIMQVHLIEFKLPRYKTETSGHATRRTKIRKVFLEVFTAVNFQNNRENANTGILCAEHSFAALIEKKN